VTARGGRPFDRDKKLLQRPLTADDETWRAARKAGALAIVEWLKGSTNTQRAIRSLSLAELELMAEAAVSAYIVEKSKQLAAEEAREPETIDPMRYFV
jgi:hypothetical protein